MATVSFEVTAAQYQRLYHHVQFARQFGFGACVIEAPHYGRGMIRLIVGEKAFRIPGFVYDPGEVVVHDGDLMEISEYERSIDRPARSVTVYLKED